MLMESPIAELSSQDLDRFKAEYENLPVRLGNWVGERPLVGAFSQNNARWQIAQLIKEDYYAIVDGRMPVHPQAQALKDTETSRKKIDTLIEDSEEDTKVYEREDAVTGEKYQLILKKESSGAYTAEEVKEGRVQTQARIRVGGSTDLTLDYHGDRFGIDNNPAILSEDLFPEAAVKVFNLLVSSVDK